MKRTVIAFAVMAMMMSPVFAGGEQVELQDLTLKGKLTTKEQKDKEGATQVAYVLTTEDGSMVKIPTPKAEGENAIVLNDFVDADVEIVAKGMEMEKEGKKRVMVKEIVTIKKAAAAAEDAVEVEAAE